MTQGIFLLVIMVEQEQFGALSRTELCKLDETDTERWTGRDELGWLVWHVVANGGS